MALFRRILEDFEAKLAPGDSSLGKARGKVERERFGNGDEEFSLRFRHLDLPDGTIVQILLREGLLGTVTIESGRGALLLRKKDGVDVPIVSVGDTVEVRHAGATVLRGVFFED